MATQDISALLAVLAAGGTPTQTPQQPPYPQQPPVQGLPPGFPPGMMPNPTPPAGAGYGLPHPTNSGPVDLSSIKPINSGSVSIQDALAKARGFAAEKGLSYNGGRPGSSPNHPLLHSHSHLTSPVSAQQDDPRLSGRSYRRSRSRSRSPPRRDMRDSYNPYRDERREDPRRGGAGYGRDRSRSPRGRNTFSPPRGYTRDRSPPAGDNSEIILIDSSLVGLVIGRQGESLRRIEQQSGTRIQFINGPDSGPQRQCRITGSASARISAKREINRIIEENGGNPAREAGRNSRSRPPNNGGGSVGGSGSSSGAGGASAAGHQPALRDGEQSSQIMVPDRTVGLIIGRGGETIRDLQERSGCHVNIVGENKSVNGLRPVNLIGSPAAAAQAKELIMEIVDSDTKTMDGPGPAGPNNNNNKRENFDPYAGGPNKINESIYVPSDAVGMIIGKGGETIKDMQSTTGCKINVSQAAGADVEREIGLVGTHQAIEDAKRAIWEKVDSVREKNGGRRGGGRDGGNANENYSQQQNQPSYAAPYGGSTAPPAAAAAPAVPAAGNPAAAAAADPYAAYGGYQNYLALWYSSIAAQQQQQGGGQGPPGAA